MGLRTTNGNSTLSEKIEAIASKLRYRVVVCFLFHSIDRDMILHENNSLNFPVNFGIYRKFSVREFFAKMPVNPVNR